MFCCVFGLVRSNVVAMCPVGAVMFQFGPCDGEGRTPWPVGRNIEQHASRELMCVHGWLS